MFAKNPICAKCHKDIDISNWANFTTTYDTDGLGKIDFEHNECPSDTISFIDPLTPGVCPCESRISKLKDRDIPQYFKPYGPNDFAICGRCFQVYLLNNYDKWQLRRFLKLGKNITSKNFVGHYVSWCTRNSIAPLHYDILVDIFTGCESNIDYEETLNALYTIQDQGIQVSFMNDKTSKEAMRIRLRIRLELFRRVPTATNMLLAYNLIEEIILKNVQEGSSDISDEMNKMIDRFDKLKNLALGTKYINERKLAFDRSVQVFEKMVK